MLSINDLTFRMAGRVLLEGATATIPTGHKVGLVGRNGAGKTTLLRVILGELAADEGSITLSRNARIGTVAQHAPSGEGSLIDTVLAADTERATLLRRAETASDPAEIAEIQLRLADIGAHSAPARAAAILAGLGFDEITQNQPCAKLSGGWRMRVALAAVLFSAPDILLLDEPTNYLDLEGTLWLEGYLKRYPHTVLIVSHDRDLLNRIPGAILHLNERRLTLYSGGYDRFEQLRRQHIETQLKLKKKQDNDRRRLEGFVARFRAKATKARQAQSRIKALQKLKPVPAMIESRVAPFDFPSPRAPVAPPLMRLEGAGAGYGETRVLADLDLGIEPDDRIGLIGANGNGKSTFAKLLAGRLSVLDGAKLHSKKLKVGYFAQHQLDELNSAQTPFEQIRERLPDLTEAQVRARLGGFGFGIDLADTKVADLSGGEKARLLFALAALDGPHLLILDEPANHLDVESREALIHALSDYEGALILISHDRHMLEACVDRLWLVDQGTVREFDGDVEDYRTLILGLKKTNAQKRDARKENGGAAPQSHDRRDARRTSAQARAKLAPLKKQVEAAERAVGELTAQIAQLDERLADGSLYRTKPDEAAQLIRQRGGLEKRRAGAEEHWLARAEEYEQAKAGASGPPD